MTSREKQFMYSIVLTEVKNNPDCTDRSIALLLKEKYETFKEKRIDSLRRYVNIIRSNEGLTKTKDYKPLNDDLKIYIEKYKGDSIVSVSKKLQLKYPEYTTGTLRNYLKDYANWNETRKT